MQLKGSQESALPKVGDPSGFTPGPVPELVQGHLVSGWSSHWRKGPRLLEALTSAGGREGRFQQNKYKVLVFLKGQNQPQRRMVRNSNAPLIRLCRKQAVLDKGTAQINDPHPSVGPSFGWKSFSLLALSRATLSNQTYRQGSRTLMSLGLSAGTRRGVDPRQCLIFASCSSQGLPLPPVVQMPL